MTISYILGENRITNDEISQRFPEWNNRRFEKRVGILQRYRSELSSLSLATKVPINLKEVNQNLIYVTQTNEFSIPGDAFIFSNEVGLNAKEVYQISSGCSGFVDALNLAFFFQNERSTIVCTDTYQSIINQAEPSNLLLFSDCASITQINTNDYTKVFYDTIVDVKNYSKIQRKNNSSNYFSMEGKEVYNFVLNTVLPFILTSLEKQNVEVLYLHQANRMMLDLMKEEIHKVYPHINIPIIIEDGNCVSSSIPKVMVDEKNITSYKSIAMCGFGVGLKASFLILKKL